MQQNYDVININIIIMKMLWCKNKIVITLLIQGWNDLNQLIKINDLNRDLNQMIFLPKF